MKSHPERTGRARVRTALRGVAIGLAVPVGMGIAHGNDDLANAASLSGALPITTSPASNENATAEFNEPDHDFDSITSHSLWWQWTAPADMAVEFSTFGSTPLDPLPGLQFDTVIAIYTGSTINDLQKVLGNDDAEDTGWVDSDADGNSYDLGSGTGQGANVKLTALEATVQRDAGSGEVGIVANLQAKNKSATFPGSVDIGYGINGSAPSSWTNVLVPAGFDGTLPLDVSSGGALSTGDTVTIWARRANGAAASFGVDLDASSSDHTLEISTPGAGDTKQSRVRFWASSGTTYKIAVDGYNGDLGYVVLNAAAFSAPQPSNDRWVNAAVISGALPQTNDLSPASTTKSNVNATVDEGEPEHVTESAFSSSVWFKWTPITSGSAAAYTTGSDFDTVLAIYRGPAIDNLTLVTFNDDDEATSQSGAQFFAFTGETYYFAVDGFAGEEGEVRFLLQWGPDPPPNDDFFSPETIASLNTVSTDGPTGGASSEFLEPDHSAGNAPVSSVWYQWTAPSDVSSSVEMNTFGSNFDTVLAVYTGDAFAVLNQIATDDDAGVLQSRLRFSPVPDQTYRIAIDGKEGAQGAAFLNIQPGPAPPPNDDFANAAVVVGNSGFGVNLGATVEASEPQHVAGIVNQATVWYQWTADLDTRYRISLSGSNFDTTLAVYSGTAIESLAQLDSNDNAGGQQSQVTFDAGIGKTYYFAVGGKDGAEGNISINIDIVGSYAEWLQAWPSLTGIYRFQNADKDGDGYSNLIEMLCGLDPTLNSRPEVAIDPNSASAPVIAYNGFASVKFTFDVDATYIGVPRNGGGPVTFGGQVIGPDEIPVATVTPSMIAPDRYEIETTLDPDQFRVLRLQVTDPNADP